MAEETHLKSPNVRRFIGRSKMPITGLAKSETIVNPTPAKNKSSQPLAKTIPCAMRETTKRENVSIT